MKNIIATILILFCAVLVRAEDDKFSYLYIQGDKQTPFYVKLEDAMQPRFGKNYCIVPKMAPGPANIEILFQQNVYPAQKFTVLMPEGGNRGFLLVRSEANGFMLYDLQQGFYLPAGNKASDDRMPEVMHAVAPAKVLTEADTRAPAPGPAEKPKSAPTPPAPAKSEPVVPNPAARDSKPVFIGDITLTKGNRSDPEPPQVPAGSQNITPSITNTDCPTPLSTTEFGKIFNAVSALPADEEKVEYLLEQMDKCYETWQARTLVGKLSGDAARFELLRKIYPRITDQSNFPALNDLLSSDVWKAEFNRLVHRK